MTYVHKTQRLDNAIVVKIVADDDYQHMFYDVNSDEKEGAIITYFKRSRDVLGTKAIDNDEWDVLEQRIETNELVALSVYAYVHSGATIRCAPFSCPWDSGQSGTVYVTREWAAKELGAKTDEEICKYLRSCVKEFDDLLTGNVWGFTISREGDPDNSDDSVVLDSCWGFVGDPEYCLEEALASAKAFCE